MENDGTKRAKWTKVLVIAGGAAIPFIVGMNSAHAQSPGDTRVEQQDLGIQDQALPGRNVKYNPATGVTTYTQTHQKLQVYRQRTDRYQQTGTQVENRTRQETQTIIDYITTPANALVPYPDPDNYPGVPREGSYLSGSITRPLTHMEWVPNPDADVYPGLPAIGSANTDSIARQISHSDWTPYPNPDNYPGLPQVSSELSNSITRQIPHTDWTPYPNPDNYPGLPQVSSELSNSITRQIPHSDWVPYPNPDNYPGLPPVSSVMSNEITRQIPHTDWHPYPNPLEYPGVPTPYSKVTGNTKTVVANSLSRETRAGVPGTVVTTTTTTYQWY